MTFRFQIRDLLWLMVVVGLASVGGCNHPSIPTLRPIARVSAKVLPVPDLGTIAIDHIDVPDAELMSFAKLITPTKLCVQNIDTSTDYRIADVTVRHTDGTETVLIVRWTGANPAAISFDDRTFYYGGSDAFPDGATRILRLLHEYHFSTPNPRP
jgi:hypothetical protein